MNSTPRSLRSNRGIDSIEATPVSEASKKRHNRPKKRDRSPALPSIEESPTRTSGKKQPERSSKRSNWPGSTDADATATGDTDADAGSEENSPEHPLAASFYGAAPFRGVEDLPNQSSLASHTAITTSAASLTASCISSTTSTTTIDYTDFNSIVSGLAHLADQSKNSELTKFVAHYKDCPYYASLDDYEQAWNYSAALYAFIARKCCDLPNITNKQRNKETKAIKAGKEDKQEYKEGDKIVWDVADQVFSVCVPCFEAGRVPTRCIFLRKVGFVNHRRVNVFDPSATSFEKCKRPAEDVGAMSCYDAYLGRQVMVKRVNRGGYAESDYRLFRLPSIREEWSTTEYECVANDSKSEGLKWAHIEGTGIEHELSIPFRAWMKKLIAGLLPECIVNPAEEAATKAADKIKAKSAKPDA